MTETEEIEIKPKLYKFKDKFPDKDEYEVHSFNHNTFNYTKHKGLDKNITLSYNNDNIIKFKFIKVKDDDPEDEPDDDIDYDYSIDKIYYNQKYDNKIAALTSIYNKEGNYIEISILDIMNYLIMEYNMSIEFMEKNYSDVQNLDYSEDITELEVVDGVLDINITLNNDCKSCNIENINIFNKITKTTLNKIIIINEINFLTIIPDNNFLELIKYKKFKHIKSEDSKIVYFLSETDNINLDSESYITLDEDIPTLDMVNNQSKISLLSEINAYYNINSVILIVVKINKKIYNYYIIRKRNNIIKHKKLNERKDLLDEGEKILQNQQALLAKHRDAQELMTQSYQDRATYQNEMREFTDRIKCQKQSIITSGDGNGCWLYSAIATIFFTDLSYKYLVNLEFGLLYSSYIDDIDNGNDYYNTDKNLIKDINLTSDFNIKIILNNNYIYFNIEDINLSDNFYKIKVKYNDSLSENKELLNNILEWNPKLLDTEVTIYFINKTTNEEFIIKRIFKAETSEPSPELEDSNIYFDNSEYNSINYIHISINSLKQYNLIDLDLKNIIFFRNINYYKTKETEGDVRGYIIDNNIDKADVTDFPEMFGGVGQGGKYLSGISYIFKFLNRVTSSKAMINANLNIINLKIIKIFFKKDGFQYWYTLNNTDPKLFIKYSEISLSSNKNIFEEILEKINFINDDISNILLIYTISSKLNNLIDGGRFHNLKVPFIMSKNYQLGSAGFSSNKFDPITKKRNTDIIKQKSGHSVSGFFCNGNQFILDTSIGNTFDINLNEIDYIDYIENIDDEALKDMTDQYKDNLTNIKKIDDDTPFLLLNDIKIYSKVLVKIGFNKIEEIGYFTFTNTSKIVYYICSLIHFITLKNESNITKFYDILKDYMNKPDLEFQEYDIIIAGKDYTIINEINKYITEHAILIGDIATNQDKLVQKLKTILLDIYKSNKCYIRLYTPYRYIYRDSNWFTDDNSIINTIKYDSIYKDKIVKINSGINGNYISIDLNLTELNTITVKITKDDRLKYLEFKLNDEYIKLASVDKSFNIFILKTGNLSEREIIFKQLREDDNLNKDKIIESATNQYHILATTEEEIPEKNINTAPYTGKIWTDVFKIDSVPILSFDKYDQIRYNSNLKKDKEEEKPFKYGFDLNNMEKEVRLLYWNTTLWDKSINN